MATADMGYQSHYDHGEWDHGHGDEHGYDEHGEHGDYGQHDEHGDYGHHDEHGEYGHHEGYGENPYQEDGDHGYDHGEHEDPHHEQYDEHGNYHGAGHEEGYEDHSHDYAGHDGHEGYEDQHGHDGYGDEHGYGEYDDHNGHGENYDPHAHNEYGHGEEYGGEEPWADEHAYEGAFDPHGVSHEAMPGGHDDPYGDHGYGDHGQDDQGYDDHGYDDHGQGDEGHGDMPPGAVSHEAQPANDDHGGGGDHHDGGGDSHGGGDGNTFTIELENTMQHGGRVFAYITGQAMDQGNKLWVAHSDGQSGSTDVTGELGQEYAIDLSHGKVTVHIPHLAGGRVWFSVDEPLKMKVNGTALVAPSVTNDSDENAHTNWGFAELTWNTSEIYANISYVDFVGLPIGMTLETEDGQRQVVKGMSTDGLQHVCDGLKEQAHADGHDWDKLIVEGHDGHPLRVLSPNQGAVKGILTNYFDDYIEECWHQLSNGLHINTQAAAGSVQGHCDGQTFTAGSCQMQKPTTKDIWTCDSGPFKTGSDAATNAIIPRIGAAFNRGTLHHAQELPEPQEDYYGGHGAGSHDAPMNHYSRIVHEANPDGKGYAFPYDDVQPDGAKDMSGCVHAPNGKVLTITVGGGAAGGDEQYDHYEQNDSQHHEESNHYDDGHGGHQDHYESSDANHHSESTHYESHS